MFLKNVVHQNKIKIKLIESKSTKNRNESKFQINQIKINRKIHVNVKQSKETK